MSFIRNFATPFFFFLLFIVSPLFANAQGGVGIGLSPATIEEAADPGATKQYSISVSNLGTSEQLLYVFTRDISGVKSGGVPIFANPDAERTGFEISEWVSLDQTEITVPGGQTREISFSMSVPENASPGSHFGGVFVSAEPPKLRSSGAAVGYDVASILSIRVAGDAIEKAQIRSFSTDNYVYGSPNVTFMSRIENQGNVLVRPIGPLEVTNMFGKEVAMLTFNENLGGVFPGVVRDFEITWSDEGPGFGRYQARLSLIYGSEGQKSTITSTVSFWILPMNIILPALGVLVVLLGGTYIAVKVYVNRKLAAYGRGRRLVRKRRQRNTMPIGLLLLVVMLGVTTVFLIILLALFA